MLRVQEPETYKLVVFRYRVHNAYLIAETLTPERSQISKGFISQHPRCSARTGVGTFLKLEGGSDGTLPFCPPKRIERNINKVGRCPDIHEEREALNPGNGQTPEHLKVTRQRRG